MVNKADANTNTLRSDADRLLTVEQAAAALCLSASTIRLYIRQGTLSAYRIAGLRKVLIREGDLLALLHPVPVTLPQSQAH